MVQPPQAACSSAWLSSWWKRFSSHQVQTSCFYLCLLFLQVHLLDEPPCRYWQAAALYPWNFFSLLNKPSEIFIHQFQLRVNKVPRQLPPQNNPPDLQVLIEICDLQRTSHHLTRVDFWTLIFLRKVSFPESIYSEQPIICFQHHQYYSRAEQVYNLRMNGLVLVTVSK